MFASLLVAAVLPFSQSWSDTAVIAVDDDWSGVPGVLGYRGDKLTAELGVDPQTVLADGSSTPVEVIANAANPDALATGGVAELELADPAVALQPSGTADAPHLVVSLDTTGWRSVRIAYLLRDLDPGADDAVQPVALQYRVGSTGDFVNVPGGFVADATSGPNLADLVTPVSAVLPAEADGRPLVQLRTLTANAAGADEWVGVDDISVAATDGRPPALSLAVATRHFLPRALRAGIPARIRADEAVDVHIQLRIGARLARRLRLARIVGRSGATIDKAGSLRATTRFSTRARRRLASVRGFRVTLRVTARDEAGNAAVVARRIVLAR